MNPLSLPTINGATAISLLPTHVDAGLAAPATEDFEALFLGQILKGMRKTVPTSDEASSSREIYEELHDEMLATHLAKHGGIGLGKIIRAYLDGAPAAGGKK